MGFRIPNMRKPKVLVLGDCCTDIFIYGQVDRICPEAPVPIIKPTHQKTNPGMSGNVAANLDFFGATITHLKNKNEIQKIRYVDELSGYIMLRVDVDDKVSEPLTAQSLLYELSNLGISRLDFFDLVVVSDYNKGYLSESVMQNIFQNSKLSFLDTKRIIGPWADQASFIKINKKELEFNLKNSDYLSSMSVKERLIVTLGAEGALYKNIVVPTKRVEIREISGAGDTFLAALSTEYFRNRDIISSIKMANHYAGLACSRQGVVSNFN